MNYRFGNGPVRLLAPVLAALLACCGNTLAGTKASSQADPWTKDQLIEPAELAKLLDAPTKPIVLDIGVAGWIKGGRIKGSIIIGPAKEPQNLEKLRASVSQYPRDTELVIYCGCCPMEHCPNIRPAFKLLNEMKFTRCKLLNLPDNFKTDWANHGFPTEK